tara:strand:+ start:288 stop:728 length:441 start_codon:yes stop_codon:yes gene_type:complete
MTYKSYQGRFKPSNPGKYKGDPTNIIYRSLWERKFMVWCDRNLNVMEWGSEEIIVPYISPLDRKPHRYFPDFYVKSKGTDGRLRKRLIEIKPYAQTQEPKRGRRTKKLLKEIATYGVNQAKWKAAREYCKDRKMEFVILTEHELKV